MRVTALGVWTHSHAGPTTSFYVQLDEVQILLDVGVDPIGRLRDMQINVTGCSHLYLSHLHADHSSGFSNFVFTRELLGRALEEGLPHLVVLGSPAVLEGGKDLLQVQYPDRNFTIDWVPLRDAVPTDLSESVTIVTAPTVHSVDCHACRILNKYGDVGFTADTAPFEPHVSFFSDCATLLGEAFGTDARVGATANDRGHSTAEDLGRLATACGASRVIPFHFGPENHDEAERSLLLAAARGAGTGTVIDPVTSPTI
jgi:ribonuclease BN (tRNA processing enzyme)